MTEAWVLGMHAVRVLLQRQPQRVSLLLIQRGREDARVHELLVQARSQRISVEMRTVQELNKLSDDAPHQGVMARVKASEALGEGALDELLDQTTVPALLLVLDGVQDPHNLGACLRTADAVGAQAVIVPRDRAVGLTATVRKVAVGAAETVPLIQVVNLARTLRWLKERAVWTVGTDDAAVATVYSVDLRMPLALVMGAEGKGLRRLTREQCDVLVKIPMQGAVESLNVSVATGVMLYEVLRQRSL